MKSWTAKEQKHKVALIAGVRTPFAKAGTDLKECSAVHLGVTAVREVMARSGLSPAVIDEVVFGNAGTPVDAANISRVIALRAGLPQGTPAYTVHRNCASAMEAVAQGCIKIACGMAETMLVGGTESMSNMPLIYSEEMKELFATLNYAKNPIDKVKKASEFRPQWLKPVVAIMEGLSDPISGLNMGQTAELLARDFKISRTEQDAFALRSHRLTVEAKKAGRFDEEVFPVIDESDFSSCVKDDVGPRDGQSTEALGRLKPFFDRENGTVTPGNACPITDGAVALILMNEAKARAEGHKVFCTIPAFAFTGCEPKRMGMGPVVSSARVMEDTGLALTDFQVVELNEAFAAQVIANIRAFGSKSYCSEHLGKGQELGELNESILNVNGGAIALGHPVGATGARLILTAALEMNRKNYNRGLATLCIGGGQGAAFVLERN
ncbi:MAG: thiolase family protein [Deltaproteobacteria bacterium]|nr:thiolase family protein [Deltaproteobacteria bacterium]MBI3296368.1 thiolase family protein [Deltaproteobacteria bacterium]